MSLKDRLYSGPLRKFVRRTGLEPRLRRLYDHIGVYLSGGSVTVTLNEYQAEFIVSSAPEFARYDLVTGERAVLEDLLSRVDEDTTVWDVGANTGLYSCLCGKAAPDGTVMAFEPHPGNARRLEDNVARNDLENVRIYERALSDHDGTAALTLDGSSYGGHHSLVSSEGATSDVEVTRAETLLNRETVPVPEIVKIDVEGAELSVLDGFGEAISEPELFYVEVHTDEVSMAEVEDVFTSAGYNVEEIHRRGSERFIRARAT